MIIIDDNTNNKFAFQLMMRLCVRSCGPMFSLQLDSTLTDRHANAHTDMLRKTFA